VFNSLVVRYCDTLPDGTCVGGASMILVCKLMQGRPKVIVVTHCYVTLGLDDISATMTYVMCEEHL
jgi:hypothetical protein